MVVLVGGIAVALLCLPRRGKRDRFAPAGDGDETELDGSNRQVSSISIDPILILTLTLT